MPAEAGRLRWALAPRAVLHTNGPCASGHERPAGGGVSPGSGRARVQMSFEVISVEQFPGDIGLPCKGSLPIPDYDHLPRYVIESRVRSLTGDDVQILLRHESRHRNRTPVLRLLTGRARELRGQGHPTPPCGG